MFIILLKFSENRSRASEFMDAHKAWISQGFDDEVFLSVGTLEPSAGGVILARGSSRDALEARIAEDPFVAENIVQAEILETTPARTEPRLEFLKG